MTLGHIVWTVDSLSLHSGQLDLQHFGSQEDQGMAGQSCSLGMCFSVSTFMPLLLLLALLAFWRKQHFFKLTKWFHGILEKHCSSTLWVSWLLFWVVLSFLQLFLLRMVKPTLWGKLQSRNKCSKKLECHCDLENHTNFMHLNCRGKKEESDLLTLTDIINKILWLGGPCDVMSMGCHPHHLFSKNQ